MGLPLAVLGQGQAKLNEVVWRSSKQRGKKGRERCEKKSLWSEGAGPTPPQVFTHRETQSCCTAFEFAGLLSAFVRGWLRAYLALAP